MTCFITFSSFLSTGTMSPCLSIQKISPFSAFNFWQALFIFEVLISLITSQLGKDAHRPITCFLTFFLFLCTGTMSACLSIQRTSPFSACNLWQGLFIFKVLISLLTSLELVSLKLKLASKSFFYIYSTRVISKLAEWVITFTTSKV